MENRVGLDGPLSIKPIAFWYDILPKYGCVDI